MKFSIITVTYNSAKTLRDTIESVLNQSYQNIEYIVVDGQSTDNTLDIIREYYPKFKGRMIYVSEPDEGIFDAMNKGIKMASGEAVAILNSDDFYCYSDVVADVVDAFQKNQVDVIYADLYYISQTTKKVVRRWISGSYNYKKFRYGWMPAHPAFFVKKTIYDQYGLFRTDMKVSNDYELVLRMLYKHRVSCAYLNRVTVHMRLGGNSAFSFYNKYTSLKEDYISWKDNGLKVPLLTIPLKPFRKIFQYFR